MSIQENRLVKFIRATHLHPSIYTPGYPPPVVRWVTGERDEGRVWQQQGATPPRAASNHPVSVVSVTLHLSHLSRDDNGRQLKCIAANTNLTLDHSKTVILDMYCESHLPHSIHSSNSNFTIISLGILISEILHNYSNMISC